MDYPTGVHAVDGECLACDNGNRLSPGLKCDVCGRLNSVFKMSNEATINYMLKYLEDKYGPSGSAEDAFQCEREAYERLEKDLRYHKDAIRCAYQNLEREANKTWPSVLSIRAALQALKPYL